jgi:bifunctional non-homologous end joining protein LigD
VAFDVLYRAGQDVTDRPLQDRRVLLADVIAGGSTYVLPVRRLADNGLDAWAQVLGSGYEGYVAKDALSTHRSGVMRSWLKVNVPGWTDPEGKFKRVRLSG